MSDHEKTYPETTENIGHHTNGRAVHTKPRRGGIRGHCARFWWLHLLIIIIIAVVVALIIVFVAVPHIAQDQLNKSDLNITNQVVANPTPQTVDLTLDSVASSNSSFHPTLDSFDAALFLENTEPNILPFAYITIPTSKAGKHVEIHASQTVNISNMDQFVAYNKLVLQAEEFRVAVRGKMPVKLSGVPKFHVNYNKAVTLKGLNGLKGFAVTNFTVLLTAQSDGTNMLGTVFIPNPSVYTVEMGNVTMNLAVAGTPIGTSLIPNLTLKPGNNTLGMRSVTNQSAVIDLILKKYTNGILPVDISGNSSVNSKGEHLAYFETAIQSNHMSISLDVGSALKSIGLNITSS